PMTDETKRTAGELHGELARGRAGDRDETAARLWDGLLAGLVHQMRSLLHASLGWAHLLQGGQLDEDSSARGLDVICRNVELQVLLLSEILDVSRILSGRLRIERQPVDMGTVMSAALTPIRKLAEAKPLRLEVSAEGSVGIVQGDPKRLQQILRQLLANAV